MYRKVTMLVCLVVFQVSSLYGDATWDGGAGDHLWTSATNWSPDGVPGTGEIAYIPGQTISPDVTINGTGLVVQDLWIARWAPGNVHVQMTGGDMVIENIFRVAEQWNDATVSTFDMNDGAMVVGDSSCAEWSGFELSYNGNSVFNMNAGTVDVYRDIKIKPIAGNYGTGILNLNGGTMTADGLVINTGGSINITDGTMILAGCDVSTVNNYVSSGLITGHAYHPRGTVNVEYDSNFDKTLITASISGVTGGDFNADCIVDICDLTILASDWLKTGLNLWADADDDNDVDFMDFAVLANTWHDKFWSDALSLTINITNASQVYNLPAQIPSNSWTELSLQVIPNTSIYLFPTGTTMSCALYPGKSIAVDSDAFDTSTSTRAATAVMYQEGIPPVIQNTHDFWRKNHFSADSAQIVSHPVLGDCVVAIFHGEHKNWSDFADPNPIIYDNTIMSPRVYNYPDDYSGYRPGIGWVDYWPAYFSFTCLSYCPVDQINNPATDWLMTYEMGPVAWPEKGHTDSNGDKVCYGTRHPSSFVNDGYFYVFYQESDNDNYHGIKTARCRLEDLWTVGSFEVYNNGTWNRSLPLEFDLDDPNFAMKGGDGKSLFSTYANSFYVAKLNETPYFLGVEQREIDGTYPSGMYLRLSDDLVNWTQGKRVLASDGSDPEFCYPAFFNEDFTNNSLINHSGFYLISGYKSDIGHFPVLHLSIELNQMN